MVRELALELELLLKVISERPVPKGARDDALPLSAPDSLSHYSFSMRLPFLSLPLLPSLCAL